MGLFGKLGQALGVSSTSSESVNIEELMTTAEMEKVDALHERADMYVKPYVVATEEEVANVEEELKNKNMILLDITELNKRPTVRNAVLSRIKQYVNKIDGDIGQLTESIILITPSRVKILKRKKTS